MPHPRLPGNTRHLGIYTRLRHQDVPTPSWWVNSVRANLFRAYVTWSCAMSNVLSCSVADQRCRVRPTAAEEESRARWGGMTAQWVTTYKARDPRMELLWGVMGVVGTRSKMSSVLRKQSGTWEQQLDGTMCNSSTGRCSVTGHHVGSLGPGDGTPSGGEIMEGRYSRARRPSTSKA